MKPPRISKAVAKVLDEQKPNRNLMNEKEIEKMKDYDLTHDHAGNGWVVLQVLEGNFYKVAPIAKGEIQMRAFLAWGGKLSPTLQNKDPRDPKSVREPVPIVGQMRDHLYNLREQIKTGKIKIKETHLKGTYPNSPPNRRRGSES
jgi:hypothetical protein